MTTATTSAPALRQQYPEGSRWMVDPTSDVLVARYTEGGSLAFTTNDGPRMDWIVVSDQVLDAIEIGNHFPLTTLQRVDDERRSIFYCDGCGSQLRIGPDGLVERCPLNRSHRGHHADETPAVHTTAACAQCGADVDQTTYWVRNELVMAWGSCPADPTHRGHTAKGVSRGG